ncbi:hypothetical protein [Flavobacterium sp.]|uniref:hypothetical protein n=1 Tax=Flavobacterium sp. TaxID=239 RepID=UPI00375321B1
MIRIKKLFIVSSLMIAILGLSSCSKEDENLSTTELKSVGNNIIKTPKMIEFEKKLNLWLLSKSSQSTDLKNSNNVEINDDIQTVSIELLDELKANEIEYKSNTNLTTDELVLLALDKYNKELNELYTKNN